MSGKLPAVVAESPEAHKDFPDFQSRHQTIVECARFSAAFARSGNYYFFLGRYFFSIDATTT